MNNKMDFLWKQALKALDGQFSEVTYKTMIKILKPVHIDDEAIYLLAPNITIKNSVEKRYYTVVSNAIKSIAGEHINIVIILEEDENKRENKTQSNLVKKYTFENFVKAQSNEFAYATSLAVAENPGTTTYNPLFLYSGVGLGKTHLMHAIGNFVKENNKDSKVLYVSSETFTNEFIASIRQGENQAFREKFRDTDVLLVDDIQFLEGKEGTQEEFFHTFNTLKDANKQIVVSSDKPPKDLKTLEERLTSRFGQGIIADLKTPDFETRMAILEKKALTEYIEIPKDVMIYIADNFSSNIRELEGALNKLKALSKVGNFEITLEMAKSALEDLSTKKKKNVDIPLIQRITADYFNITTTDLTGKKRSKNIAFPRQIAMYLSRKLLDIPLTSVGEAFGGRDHSTVIHSCEKIADVVENDYEIKNLISEIEKLITQD